MKKFILGFTITISLFFSSCDFYVNSDVDFFKSKGWFLDKHFKIDSKGTFEMGDYENILLTKKDKDTTIYFEYLKREESLQALRYEKLFSSKKLDSNEKLYHRLGLNKKDTLFYYTSSIPENATKIDLMTFIIGKEYYLKLIGKNQKKI